MSNEPTPESPDSAEQEISDVVSADPDEISVDQDSFVDNASSVADPTREDPALAPDSAEAGEPSQSAPYVPPQVPPYTAAPPVPPVRRLVRDPYSRLGGVASGIAHHTGVDVSLVRLAFVLSTIFGGGVGLIIYLLAWLIVPRAEYWPPAPYVAGTGRSLLDGRRLAYGLLAAGIFLVIISGAGGFARMLVSVGLVGAGIWLLVQPQSAKQVDSPNASPMAPPPQPDSTAPVAGTATVGATAGAATASAATVADVPSTWQPAPGQVGPDLSADDMVSSYAGPSGPSGPTGPVNTVYVPSPVPPRRRRIWPFFLIGAILLVPFMILIGGLAFFAANEKEFTDTNLTIEPMSVDEIPRRIDEGTGTITLDLGNLTIDDFSELGANGQEIDIDLTAGEIFVDLPSGVPVEVDASAGAGEVSVLGRYEEGIRPGIITGDDDPVLELDIRVGLGSITVDD